VSRVAPVNAQSSQCKKWRSIRCTGRATHYHSGLVGPPLGMVVDETAAVSVSILGSYFLLPFILVSPQLPNPPCHHATIVRPAVSCCHACVFLFCTVSVDPVNNPSGKLHYFHPIPGKHVMNLGRLNKPANQSANGFVCPSSHIYGDMPNYLSIVSGVFLFLTTWRATV